MYSFSSSIYQSHAPSAKLAGGPALIVTEDLSIKNVTASARATADKASELNREILDTAPRFRKCPARQSARGWVSRGFTGPTEASAFADMSFLRQRR
jgi:hypothetical protein